MKTYSELTGRLPDFAVRYRFFTPLEGGRGEPPKQHIRWDFKYKNSNNLGGDIFHIWPEFIDSYGEALPDGNVPFEGNANMFIVFPISKVFHQKHITLGTRGFFVEGSRNVAECEVTAILGL